MNKYIRNMISVLADTFDFSEPVWEFGSYIVQGQEEIGNLRDFFPGKEYIGLDMREGPGVDRIENVEHINTPDNSAGSIICTSLFEHVQDIFTGASEIYRVLKPGGIMVMTTPFDLHIHDYPGDYWRFTPQGLTWLNRRFPLALAGYHGYKEDPLTSILIGFKHNDSSKVEPHIEPLTQQLKETLTASKPHLDRRIKLAIARRLAGNKFFRNYDNRNDVKLWLVRNMDSKSE